MRESSGWQGVLGGLGVGLLTLIAGCQSPGSQPIIGPDGSPMAHVHCGADQGQCFRIAGELCPSGYELKPVLRGNDGNFLVRCRDGRAPATATGSSPLAASPSNVVVTHTPGLMDPWPPAAEPAPATYPWPAPDTSASARSQTKAAAGSSEVDVGY